jgi:hypothetical protein
MKALIAMFALLALPVQADTILLDTTKGFGYLHQYHAVQNSVEGVYGLHAVDIYAPNVLLLDGENYLRVTGTDIFLGQLSGVAVTMTLVETSIRKYISQGRLHRYVTVWTLVSGVVQTP